MKKIALMFAIATMSVATVQAQDKKEAPKKECCSKDKKACDKDKKACSEKEMKTCSKDKKASCCAKKADKKA